MQALQDVSPQKIQEFQEKIIRFYEDSGRHDLSFRQTKDPYHIHISEIMLSQTQVSRVEKYFTAWTEKFQAPFDVANATNEELLKMWQGLGFNSRVLNFKAACSQIVEMYGGSYPTTKEELIKLKGVGSYVASAICAFAYNQDIGVVDTNIRRILIHEGFAHEDTSTSKLEQIAQLLIPKGKGRDWNNALMDYGALKLTARKSNIKSVGNQTKFVGSSRYIRSFVVKECLRNSFCEISKVEEECLKYGLNSQEILDKMIVQNIICKENDLLKIKN